MYNTIQMLIPFPHKQWFAFLLNFIPYQIKLYIFDLYTFVWTYNLDLWENVTGILNESINWYSNLQVNQTLQTCKLNFGPLQVCSSSIL